MKSGTALTNAGHVSINSNATLTGIGALDSSLPDFAALRGVTSLTISANPSLKQVALPALGGVSSWLHVLDNAQLPTCRAQALATQTNNSGWASVNISGNDDAATCP